MRLCHETDPSGIALAVDHDHKTKKVRGLLCVRCNNGIGQLKESPAVRSCNSQSSISITMLIDPQGNKLGDKNIQDADAIARAKEGVRKLAAPKRLTNQDLLEKQDMALGNPMSPSLFIEKLRKLPGIIVEPGGIPNAVAVRTWITGEDGKPEKKYLSGFYVDRLLPEYSSILPNHAGLPTREIRGWRTVLLALFHAGVVPLSTLRAVFGDANGQRASLWQEQTQGKS